VFLVAGGDEAVDLKGGKVVLGGGFARGWVAGGWCGGWFGVRVVDEGRW
jgi:hypothetical protein